MELKIDVEVAESNLASLVTEANKLEGTVAEITDMMSKLSESYQGVSSGVIASAIVKFNKEIGNIQAAIVAVQEKIKKYVENAKLADKAASLAVNDKGAPSNGANYTN